MSLNKKILLYLLLFIGTLGIMLYLFAKPTQAEEADCPPLLRLHVIAASDSAYDQALKLEVRDGIIELLRDSLREAATVEEAEALLTDRLPEINDAARGILAGKADYGCRTEIAVCEFPTKAYGELVLPAGEYKALRVILGSGEGHNWWCVLFPSLCYVDAVGEVNDTMAVSTGREGVKLKWKIIELLRALK